ncbi:hypothetical protein [Novosphingobium sp. KACC 22771]|uniref:hypothetical protein n=1 Tax=Novosphingobium sp. KACC 22771 TaxID=3025670 RepID=UPI0023673378|nr:hypothetical protein [Novosphingobium sp. KACC 22771]WDF73434.1 hypothetical protein PQ467_05150 [Novosphingobium sp. KACC 22771]
MNAPTAIDDIPEHFAHCIQVLGGTTAASRRLGIDERAIRRFINGERPISENLMQDTARALNHMAAEATDAAARIAATLGTP